MAAERESLAEQAYLSLSPVSSPFLRFLRLVARSWGRLLSVLLGKPTLDKWAQCPRLGAGHSRGNLRLPKGSFDTIWSSESGEHEPVPQTRHPISECALCCDCDREGRIDIWTCSFAAVGHPPQ